MALLSKNLLREGFEWILKFASDMGANFVTHSILQGKNADTITDAIGKKVAEGDFESIKTITDDMFGNTSEGTQAKRDLTKLQENRGHYSGLEGNEHTDFNSGISKFYRGLSYLASLPQSTRDKLFRRNFIDPDEQTRLDFWAEFIRCDDNNKRFAWLQAIGCADLNEREKIERALNEFAATTLKVFNDNWEVRIKAKEARANRPPTTLQLFWLAPEDSLPGDPPPTPQTKTVIWCKRIWFGLFGLGLIIFLIRTFSH